MDMEVLLTHEKGLLFSGTNPAGARVSIGRPGESPEATSPMEMLLEAVAGCSSIDVLMILEKQKASVDRYQVGTDALPGKVARAVQLSLEKYCSVAKTIDPSVAIRYTLEVNGQAVEFPEKE